MIKKEDSVIVRGQSNGKVFGVNPGKKTVNVAGYTKVSKKITGLKGGKRYYVRIRTYKTISGTKYYSPWSKAKTVTTKK